MPVLKELALNPDYRNSDGTFSPGNMRVLGALQEATGRVLIASEASKAYRSLRAHYPQDELPPPNTLRGGPPTGRVRRPSPETLRTRAVLENSPKAKTTDIARAADVSESTVRNVRIRG
jgi:hypothetical protein